jgi:ribonucleoside-diphosphate reductase alpha chain
MTEKDQAPAALTDIALTVLKKRYLIKDDQGRATETPETMFRRVADTIAEVDAHYGATRERVLERSDQFYHLMTAGLFEPNSPTLMNAGRPLGQLSACFAAGTMIETIEGPVPIEEVVVGTLVLTHEGRYRPVTETMRRIGKLYRVKVDKLPALYVTGEHPFLTTDGWIQVQNLIAKQHFVRIGVPDVATEQVVMSFDGHVENGWVYQRLEGASRRSQQRYAQRDAISRQVSPIRDQVVVDSDIAWMLGLYLAEGSISAGYDIRFTLSWDEEDQAARLSTILESRLGLPSRVMRQTQPENRRGEGWTSVRVHSKQFAQWLFEHFGTGFDHKRLPSWVFRVAPEVRSALLEGVAAGDGTPINAHQIRITLSNEILVRQLFLLAYGLGYHATLRSEKMPALGTVQPWAVAYGETHNAGMVHDGAYRVSQVTPLDEEAVVYNFEVEDDHTYIANQIIVHNCFVLPIEDDLNSIYETLKHQALVHQSGGGTGFSFSRLRPRNDIVRSTMGVASGPVSFMDVYNHSTEAIKQGGTRRGANMGILRVDHPDILEFITVKQDLSKVTNFNISVAITDVFMWAVQEDEYYDLLNPRTGELQIASRDGLRNPLTGEVLVEPGQPARLRARYVFDLIIQCAHATGEPGLFFIDRANQYNPVPQLGRYEATNPCGEQPLLAHDVCNLGSINLGAFVNEAGEIDWEQLREVTHQSTRFLDNVIDANHYPLPEISALSQRIRRIGLGVMGWADMLVRLGIPYNSHEAIELGREVMVFIDEESKVASEQIAAERGAFPEWERSIWGPDATCARDEQGQRIRPERRLRNCNLTTVAPTGTISIIAGCSSGIEPLFAVAFWRHQAEARMLDINPDFVARAQREGWYSEELMARIADSGHIHHPEVPQAVQRAFVTAHDVTPEWHIRMQGAFQDYVDSAISKTCNFSYEATPNDIRAAYELAFSLGCKGVTVYRDGSRANQVLSTGATAKPGEATMQLKVEPAPEAPAPALLRPRKVPAQGLPSRSYPVETPLGKLRLFVNELDGRPFEVFAIIGRAGSDVMAFTEAIGRLLSLALRCGIPVRLLAEQLRGIGGSRSAGFGPNQVRSVPDAIGKLLQDHYVNDPGGIGANGNGHIVATLADYADIEVHTEPLLVGELCPDCQNATLMNEEGCRKCHTCGYAEC